MLALKEAGVQLISRNGRDRTKRHIVEALTKLKPTGRRSGLGPALRCARRRRDPDRRFGLVLLVTRGQRRFTLPRKNRPCYARERGAIMERRVEGAPLGALFGVCWWGITELARRLGGR